jgi:hypothetical protein
VTAIRQNSTGRKRDPADDGPRPVALWDPFRAGRAAIA